MKNRNIQKLVLTALSLGFAGLVTAASAPDEESASLAPAPQVDAGLIPVPDGVKMPQLGGSVHDLPHPLGEQRRELRKVAHEQQLRAEASGSSSSGAANGNGKVVEVAQGQFVELARQGEDLIWTVLADFGDQESPFGILQGGLVGPARNEIPEPSANDNTTIWRDDFSRDYYLDMLFNDADGANSMRNFYKEQSSGRYAVDGDVTDWVSVPFRAAHYGRNWCGTVCFTTWWFVEDAINAWYQSKLDAGMSPAEIDGYLSQYDVWDRYDHDGDGNFDEPDGYIDHFQAVHAGEGAEAGGGAYGQDAIWSHRWYVQTVPIGADGPTLDDGTINPAGGIPVGGSKYWIGDYTIEPENGGVGVFAHEFGHDLGLPDLYNTGPGTSNGTGFWTLMSSGSWTSDGTVDIGSKPTHMGAWEKFQLGWLNYEIGVSGRKSEHKLGPAETNTRQAQGLFVIAPDKVVVEELAQPYEGGHFYYSGSGANLENTMLRPVSLPAGSTLSAQVILDIEDDWDYAYLIVSTDGGASFDFVATNLSTSSDPNGQNFGNGITGNSGGAWVELTADLSAYTGDVLLGFYYWTDGFVNPLGIMIDAIDITGSPLDGAESDAGWSFDGFSVTTGTETNSYFNAYVAEFRQYRGYDEALQTGPYNFGFLHDPATQNTVEHYPYQDGLLISYWDSSQVNNNTASHPGEGLILPIDAHPDPMYLDESIFGPGVFWSASRQTFDATFSLQPTDPITLTWFGFPTHYPSLPGVSVFNANNDYWTPEMPAASVNPPKSDTQIWIKSVSAIGSFMQVEVR
ncbi:MAG: immune inhibitor A [Gammaproteobacteria bacterium]|nr:immune inhibitor A [Gammaproteobacteria bacterium]